MQINKNEIIALENIILKILNYGIGGVLCLTGTIIMATHTYLKLNYPDWLVAGLISIIIGFILIMTHRVFNFILNLKIKNLNKKITTNLQKD